jgi:peroxiredoxin
MKTKAILASLALLGTACVLVAQDGLHLPVGADAPGFSGTATDGKEYSLKSLTAEKPAFVVFWKNPCPHNPRAAALLNAINKAYDGKAQLIGIVNSPEDGTKKFVEQFSLNFPHLSDPDKATIKAYALRFSITIMEIGKDGKIAKVFPGYGKDAMTALNEAMAKAAGMSVADVDLSAAPGRATWG